MDTYANILRVGSGEVTAWLLEQLKWTRFAGIKRTKRRQVLICKRIYILSL